MTDDEKGHRAETPATGGPDLRDVLSREREVFEDFILLEAAWRLGVFVERAVDGRWLADVPSIPGAAAYGSTRYEAIAGVLPFIEQRNAELRAKREMEHRQRMFVVTFGGLLACIALAVAAALWR